MTEPNPQAPVQIQKSNDVRRRRVLEYLFQKAGIRIKPACARCGRPFWIERPRFDPDRSAFCPECKPRTDMATNLGTQCDCGEQAEVLAYLTIHHPDSPSTTSEPMALCILCAIDELLARLRRLR